MGKRRHGNTNYVPWSEAPVFMLVICSQAHTHTQQTVISKSDRGLLTSIEMRWPDTLLCYEVTPEVPFVRNDAFKSTDMALSLNCIVSVRVPLALQPVGSCISSSLPRDGCTHLCHYDYAHTPFFFFTWSSLFTPFSSVCILHSVRPHTSIPFSRFIFCSLHPWQQPPILLLSPPPFFSSTPTVQMALRSGHKMVSGVCIMWFRVSLAL